MIALAIVCEMKLKSAGVGAEIQPQPVSTQAPLHNAFQGISQHIAFFSR